VGSTDQNEIPTTSTERSDLYDSDRTVILRKLSNQLSINEDNDNDNEEQTDVNQLTAEQIQRRMKAFALTKKMKRVQEERDAMYGIMAIEKEKENREHFSVNQTTDVESEHEQK
jgi:ATP-dependent Lon protease